MTGDRFRRVIGETGRVAEKKLNKRLGGRLTPGSGNQPGAKGDIDLGEFLLETKATEADSYRLDHETLAKIEREALAKGKNPAFHVQFVDPRGNAKRFGSWVAIPEWLWEDVRRAIAFRSEE
jgi:hypothetical protein